tara:strand:+ start:1580 stop:1789 length:210 start_codon:yes stop_codon:yes gene_type:complete
MDNVNLNKLAHTLAIEDCKRMYGVEAMYKINYDEFCGLVLKAPVKKTYNKLYDRYYLTLNKLKNDKNEI